MTGGCRRQGLLQLIPVRTAPYVEQLSIGPGRRTLAISLAILITAFLLAMLLSFGPGGRPESKEERVTVVTLEPASAAQEENSADPEPADDRAAAPQPQPEQTPPPEPAKPPPPLPAEPKIAPPIAVPSERPRPPANPPNVARPPGGPVYGPPDTARPSSASGDSKVVGTAPNGEPLYAATWYREPSDGELRGYLSTASGPGWGLIACRTAPDYRVEDCVGLDEYPTGSQINRAVLAAAWQFQVRPPRRGGRLLVGSWVRIRIDYGIRGR
jgi:protein TonB